MSDDTLIHRAAQMVASARRVAVLTGAGISAESGVPTFRDAGGLWANEHAEKVASVEGFAADPPGVWRWYHQRRREMSQAQPNPGHLALAALERRITADGGEFTLITQNVDCLHAAAGSQNVLEMHGSLADVRCTRCEFRRRVGLGPIEDVPTCPQCHAILRPDVVWFGESLPQDAWLAAARACAACELFMTVGTSAIVYPASGLIELAVGAGAKTIEVNVEPTPASGMVDIALQGPAGYILPQIVR